MILPFDAPALLSDGDIDEAAIVHIHTTTEKDIVYVDFQFVAAENVVVHQRAKQVVCRRDGVHVPREMQVDVGHGYDLGIAAPCRAALDAEYGTERRLAQSEADLFADTAHAVGKTDGDGRLAFARRRGVDGSDQNEFALFSAYGNGDLRFVSAVKFRLVLSQSEFRGNFPYVLGFRAFRNLDIAQHDLFRPPLYVRRKKKHFPSKHGKQHLFSPSAVKKFYYP